MELGGWALFTATFLASIMETVETITILLATGITRGWRSAFLGAAVGAVVLATITYIFGFHLIEYVPIHVLQVVIGGFLLIFGLQWVRKAILRYVGMKALHDEERIFAELVKELALADAPGVAARSSAAAGSTQAPRPAAAAASRETSPALGVDWQGFTIAFKGVLLEGLEVVFIVITFGANASSEELFGLSGVGLATFAAVTAALLVSAAAVAIHRPLAQVPENDMKMAVGLMLVAFGTYWAGEGIGIVWTWGDPTIVALMVLFGLSSWAAVMALRKAAMAEVTA